MTWHALIVEDDPAWRELLGEMLEDLGARITTADSYESAMAAIQRGPYDLALLDLSLESEDHENRDGMRVLARFREQWPDAPTVLITGYGTVDVAVQALTTYGARDFIRKEAFDRRRFLETVRRVVNTRPPTPLVTSHAPPRATATTNGTPSAVGGRVLVVEDNPAWQSIFQELFEDLGCQVFISVSYAEARGWLQREPFDLVVTDLKLVSSVSPWENRDGFHMLRVAREKNVPAIVVSGLATPEEIDRAFEEFGVFGFFDKEGLQRDSFLRLAHTTLQQSQQQTPSHSARGPNPLDTLTDRQMEVLRLLAQGKTNKEIAAALIVTTNTVKKHVLAIFDKLGVNSRAAAVAVALQHGLEIETDATPKK